ncbi:unnamed protein product [Paramecium pentaurelia]|uniref:ADP/ATP translocase n=1 Tax=Paramecium pentaurelia TaxID=43138 RepID=A0A8S1WA12_9CILI|nr:unnamed protein product [Paramecium pentaurelia]
MNDFLRDFLIGGVSASISKSAVIPFQTIKLLYEPQDSGLLGCFIRVCKQEPISAFWRGSLTILTMYAPNKALNFAFNDVYKTLFCSYCKQQDSKEQKYLLFLGNMLSGGSAGGTSLLLIYPLDFARNRQDIVISKKIGRQFKSVIDCGKKVYKQEGLLALYKGFGIQALGIIAYRSVYFGFYDTAKETIFKDRMMSNFVSKFIVAYSISSTAAIVSSPLDTIRRRMMMQLRSPQLNYKNSIDCTVQIFNKEGFKSFFKGAFNYPQRVSSSALCLVLYDQIYQFIALGSKLQGGD